MLDERIARRNHKVGPVEISINFKAALLDDAIKRNDIDEGILHASDLKKL